MVKEYFESILIPKLRELKVSDDYILKIVNNIETQIYSLLKHWNEPKFRETILFLGMEEGSFYRPKEASLKVKCFVVMTIRNSLIETIGSVDYKEAGLETYISDEDVISITMGAVKYFDNVNLRKLSENLDYTGYEDVYFNIVNKYKMAWNSLVELCFCAGKEKTFEKVKEYSVLEIKDLPKVKENNKENKEMMAKDIQSGISPLFSTGLINVIKNIISSPNNKYFYVDCFKKITRNFEKLLQLIEILLQNNKCIVTSNYYISNDYVAKREKLLRAAHNTLEAEEKSKMLSGLSKKHYDALRYILSSFLI